MYTQRVTTSVSLAFVVAALCTPLAFSQDTPIKSKRLPRPLHGTVQQNSLNLNVGKADSGVGSHKSGLDILQSGVQKTTLDAELNQTSAWPSADGSPNSELDAFFGSASTNAAPPAAAASPAGKVTEAHVPAGGGTNNGGNTDLKPPVQSSSVPDTMTVIRMTGYCEDTNITPRINYDAVCMAQTLLEGRKTKPVILLERMSVKLVSTGCMDMTVNGNLISFKKLMRTFMTHGGRVVVNKTWADDYSFQIPDAIGGVEFLTQSQVGELLVDATKVIDYATPNYPSNLKFFMGQPAAPAASSYR